MTARELGQQLVKESMVNPIPVHLRKIPVISDILPGVNNVVKNAVAPNKAGSFKESFNIPGVGGFSLQNILKY